MSIESRFRTIAQQQPQQPAIESASGVWTYQQVATASAACAQQLSALMAPHRCETLALLATREPSLPIVVLACLRAGLPFAILDAAYPDAHIARMLEVLPAPLLLDLRAPPAAPRQLGRHGPGAAMGEGLLRAMTATVLSDTPAPASPGPVAYYLFTSGSTGVPKCIETPAAPLDHFLCWYTQAFASGPSTRYAMLSGLSHDPILRDMLAPLSSGGVLCIPEQGLLLQARALCQWLGAQRIARLHTTPPMLALLSAARAAAPPLQDLQCVFSGGDVLRAAQVANWRRLAPQCQVVNFYGTSETPQAVAWHPVGQQAPDPIPVGQGIDGVDLLVLDAHLQPLPPGATGQVAVRSAYLSSGYRGDAEASRRQYRALGPEDGRTTYLTGDLGYRNWQGDVVLTGRADDQINLHGHRIELGAIQAALLQCPQVASALVLPIEVPGGEKKLCAYIVGQAASTDRARDERELKQQLSATLPQHMVPSLWTWLPALPLLPNGKVNRQQLIADTLARLQAAVPASAATSGLGQALQALLGVPVTPADSFVSLGGDSLSFIRASMLIEDHLGHLPPAWEHLTLAELEQQGRSPHVQGPAARPSCWTTVETTLLLRVVSIVLVILSHAGSHAIVLMATSTLFVVSGMSYSRFLRPPLRASGRLAPALHFIARFGVLAALWQAARSVYLERLWVPDLLLLGTFFQKPGGAHFTFWYLDVLAANVLLLALLDKVLRRRQLAARTDTFAQDCGLLALGLAMVFVQVHFVLWNGVVGQDSVAPFKWFWMLALGLLITQARTRLRRAGLTLFVLGLALLAFGETTALREVFEHQLTSFFLFTLLLLVWVDRVPVPRLLRPLLVEVGSATLTIYIVNHAVINVLMPRLGLPDWLWLQLSLALGVGCLTHRAWSALTRTLGAWRSRAPEAARRLQSP